MSPLVWVIFTTYHHIFAIGNDELDGKLSYNRACFTAATTNIIMPVRYRDLL